MKKILLIIIMILFFTGCQVNYEFDFDNMEESIILMNNNTYYELDSIGDSLKQIIDINSDETASTGFYNFEKIIGDKYSGIKMKYNYSNYSSYMSYSPFLKGCFEDIKISENRNILTIKSSKKISCYENFDSLEVSLKVKGRLISTNASKKEKNKYTWYFKNNDNKSIELQVERKIQKNYTNYSYVIIILVSGLIVALVSFMVYNKSKRVNKI